MGDGYAAGFVYIDVRLLVPAYLKKFLEIIRGALVVLQRVKIIAKPVFDGRPSLVAHLGDFIDSQLNFNVGVLRPRLRASQTIFFRPARDNRMLTKDLLTVP